MVSRNARTLKQRVLRAGGWTLAGLASSQAVRLGGNLVMTRLLVPEMFGVMTIVTMVQVMLLMLSDIGLRQNIVQSRRGDDPDFLDTAWVVQIFRGLVLWLLALGLSAALYFANRGGMLPADSVYASPELPLVIAVSTFSAAILGFQSTRIATAYRNFNQARIAQIELSSQLLGLGAMIVLGAMTRSIWALVSGGLVAALASTVLSHVWMSGHANRFRWNQQALRELIEFGKWLFVSSALGVFAANGDRLMLGGFVGTKVLGMYAIAALIVGAIVGGLSRLFMTVSLPALSEIARTDASRLREVYYRLRIPGDLLLLFFAGFLFLAGQRVIDLLYDPRYAEAGGMLEVLGLSLFAARYIVVQQVYVAVGIPRYQTVVVAVRFLSLYTLVPALYYAAGVNAAIWGIALHGLATVPFVYRFNGLLGLIDARRELMVLIALPAGMLCGAALNIVAV